MAVLLASPVLAPGKRCCTAENQKQAAACILFLKFGVEPGPLSCIDTVRCYLNMPCRSQLRAPFCRVPSQIGTPSYPTHLCARAAIRAWPQPDTSARACVFRALVYFVLLVSLIDADFASV